MVQIIKAGKSRNAKKTYLSKENTQIDHKRPKIDIDNIMQGNDLRKILGR